MRVGIDVGGTFTDVVLVDDHTGEIFCTKVNTTPKDLASGVLQGVDKVLEISGKNPSQIQYLVHGTTIGTNALIERKGARTGLITTEGFVDVLEIGRIQRPRDGLYDFSVDNPLPLVPRYLRKGVRERVGSRGEVVIPLDEDSAEAAIAALKKEKVESIAVSLLFSFLHPEHELRIGEMVRELIPSVFVSLSCEVAPEFREYERTSTTVINAYLLPIVNRYIETLVQRLKARYGETDLRIMIASGGSMASETAKNYAVHTVNSGPAGGALAGCFIGGLTHHKNLITVDMGGTSFDISLTDKGIPQVTSDGKFEDFPVKIPIIDLKAIGAGGGSLAWLDRGGALNVGPESAGAEPGPACYGRGGKHPTVTDANLLLGRLNPDYFLGGEMPLDKALAEEAIRKHVGEPLGMSAEAAAWGIVKVVNANMIKGISVNSIERGFDLREFSLVAFGGAGGLHAAELAMEMGIQDVLIPPMAGDFSAVGLLVSDTRHDYVQTIMKDALQADPKEVTRIFQELERKGTEKLRSQRVAKAQMEILWSADLRFKGQSYEINTPVERRQSLSSEDLKRIAKKFNEIHERIYAYGSLDEEIELVNLRVVAIGKSPPVVLKKISQRIGADPSEGEKEIRAVFFEEGGFQQARIFERERLVPGMIIRGPAVLEEPLSGTVIPPGIRCAVDEYGNLTITVAKKE